MENKVSSFCQPPKKKRNNYSFFASGLYLHGMVSFDGQVPKKNLILVYTVR
jgi:hypothetical protein